MFILRIITENRSQSNRCIGSFYEVILKNQQEEAFSAAYKLSFGHPPTNDDIYAFVVSEQGDYLPLVRQDWNYIMTETGKTFSKI